MEILYTFMGAWTVGYVFSLGVLVRDRDFKVLEIMWWEAPLMILLWPVFVYFTRKEIK